MATLPVDLPLELAAHVTIGACYHHMYVENHVLSNHYVREMFIQTIHSCMNGKFDHACYFNYSDYLFILLWIPNIHEMSPYKIGMPYYWIAFFFLFLFIKNSYKLLL